MVARRRSRPPASAGQATGLDSRREEREKWGSGRKLAAAHADPRSVWFRNSLRGAIGLALAVTVVEVTDVNHGFWVVLGCLSVLRSNALGTGATALRALAGTVVGFVVGSAIMVGLGSHYDLLWAVLPIAVLLSGVAPTAISFAAGQAGFTVVVVVLFNIIQPTGWKVGLTRIEDVAIGCAVSLVVGFLFWPRGATAALGRALGERVRGRFRVPAPGGRTDDVAGRHARHRRGQARHRRPLRPARRRVPPVHGRTGREAGQPGGRDRPHGRRGPHPRRGVLARHPAADVRSRPATRRWRRS